jgi:hypothetical protein
MKYILFLLMAALSAPGAYARDALVLKLNDCRFVEGFIIDVDDEVTFLNTEGQIQKFSIDNISLILTYGVSRSPIDKKALLPITLNKHIKSIKLRNVDRPVIGFPFQFIEDLSFVMGIDGQIYVLSLDEIVGIKDFETVSDISIPSSEKYTFDYKDYKGSCKVKNNLKNTILRPVRVLGDGIKISEFIDSYKFGHRRFKDLQERTLFYAKPFLYPRRNRLGLISLKSKKTNIPIYFQWSTGEDFHFQSVNRFGGVLSEYLPSFETGLAFSSEFKSHFFHGYFEGNLLAISSGNSTVDLEAQNVSNGSFFMNYNYMAFMGVDWKKFSFSYGGGYLTPLFSVSKLEKRSLTANKLSSSAMIRYTANNFKLKGIIYKIDDSSTSSLDIKDQITLLTSGSEDIKSFKVKADMVRLGGEVDLYDGISIGGDYLYGKGEYQEVISTTTNTIDFETAERLIYLKKQFGHHVTLKIISKTNDTNLDFSVNSRKDKESNKDQVYGGFFELLF